jgi:nicotinamide N-methyltransferase
MRETMERMEEEHAEMVTEVEAQIKRALASMAVDVDESDYEGDVASRPGSRMSAARSTASGSRSRRVSDPIKGGSVSSGSRLRSFGTESTPAEQYENGDETLVHRKSDCETDTIAEEDETLDRNSG